MEATYIKVNRNYRIEVLNGSYYPQYQGQMTWVYFKKGNKQQSWKTEASAQKAIAKHMEETGYVEESVSEEPAQEAPTVEQEALTPGSEVLIQNGTYYGQHGTVASEPFIDEWKEQTVWVKLSEGMARGRKIAYYPRHLTPVQESPTPEPTIDREKLKRNLASFFYAFYKYSFVLTTEKARENAAKPWEFSPRQQQMLDEAVTRARALGRPFEDWEIFQPIWDEGDEIVPQMDKRFVLVQEATAKTHRLWGLVQAQDTTSEPDDKLVHDPCGHTYMARVVGNVLTACPECVVFEEACEAEYQEEQQTLQQAWDELQAVPSYVEQQAAQFADESAREEVVA